jgi:hypothetical protein
MFPELTASLQAPPEDFAGKFLVAFAGGTAPDGGVTGLSVFRSYIGKKMLKSIQPYVDSDAEVKKMLTEDYVPAAVKGRATPLRSSSSPVQTMASASSSGALGSGSRT